MTQRRDASNEKSRFDNLVSSAVLLSNTFSALGMQDDLEVILDKMRLAQSKLVDKIKAMPTGIEYKATVYIRKPYSLDNESIKIEDAVIFMREDLVSWNIQSSKDNNHNQFGHYQDIFKDSNLKVRLAKDEATLVYSERV